MKKLLLLYSVLLMSCTSTQDTQVLVLSTIHGAHEKNPHFTYEDLFSMVRHFSPDLIGIEIRPEDINENEDYLKSFYPLEMRMLRDSFPDKVAGLDFYGEAVRGTLIPNDIFKDSTQELGRYVLLMRKLAQDPVIIEKEKQLGLEKILEQQKQMALEDSPQDFLNGNYDSITIQYYHLLDSLLLNTEYRGYSDFNRRRDIEITRNALELVENNSGKKVMILVGANHRGRIIDSLNNREGVKTISNLNFGEK